MRIKTLLKIAAVVLVLLIGAVVVAVSTLDPNDYRAEIAAQLQSDLGHAVSIDGPLTFEFSFSPTIAASNVRIANAEWGSRPDLAKIGHFEVQVALLPLLNGDVAIRRVVMKDADILLEIDAQGRRNWAYGGGESGSGGGRGAPRISIDDLSIESSRLTFVNGVTGVTRELAIDAFSLQAPAGESAKVHASLSLDKVPITMDGSVGSLDDLAAGNDTPVSLQLSGSDVSADVDGTLGALGSDKAIDAKVTLELGSLDILRLFGVAEVPATGPIRFSGHVAGGLAAVAVDGMDLAVMGSTVTGTLSADLSGTRPALKGDLSVDRIDLDSLSGADSAPASSSDKVFPDTPLPFDALGMLDADLKLAVGEVSSQGLPLHDVALHAVLAGGKLTLDPMTMKLAQSDVSGKASVDASSGASAKLALALASPSLDVGGLLRDTNATQALTGKADVKIDVNGAGNSVAAIMASLNGKAEGTMADGKLDESGLDLLVGGATAIVGGLFSTDADNANLSCLAVAYDIKDGLATQKVLLLDTQYSTVTGEGTIDLGKETLDLTLTPRSKRVTLNMSVPVHIGGTLAHPTYTPDEGALALKVGSLLGSTVFPPALLLGLGDVGLSKGHPCLDANTLGDGSGAAASGDSGGVVDKAGSAIDDAVKGVGEGLNSLFGN